MKKLRLGQKVVFSRVLERHRELDGEVIWHVVPCGIKTGYLVGLRTVKTGYIVRQSDDDGFSGRTYYWNEFHQKGTVAAALVVTDMYQNPIYIPREELRSDVS